MKRMPVLFAGHGSPMIALENSEITGTLRQLGELIEADFGKPKGILLISAHWYTRGTWLTASEKPEMIYDMYGFPPALYEVVYPAPGDRALAEKTAELIGPEAHLTEEWGLDHGAWSLLVHLFPNADIPVIQLSVDGTLSNQEIYELGRKLIPLRDEGILIVASGALVHNLGYRQPDAAQPFAPSANFHNYVNSVLASGNYQDLSQFDQHPDASFAATTPEHFLPLLYALGAADHDPARIFNDVIQSGAIDMTGYVFGL